MTLRRWLGPLWLESSGNRERSTGSFVTATPEHRTPPIEQTLHLQKISRRLRELGGNVMSLFRSRVLLILVSALAVSNTQAATIFDFEANTSGTLTPFTDTIGSLSAIFGGSAAVCASGSLFQSLTGNVLIQAFCRSLQTGPLTISFSSNITNLSLNF